MEQLMGRFVWHDLMTTDIESAIDFFVGLFGWSIQVVDSGSGGANYRVFHAAGRAMGGFVAMDPVHGVASHWLGYVSVQDLDHVVTAADAAGGSIAVAPTHIPQVGRFAVLRDPSGGTLAPLQRDPKFDEPQRDSEDGQICWNELHSSDPADCADYYATVFGWRAAERELAAYGPYTVFSDHSKDLAGMAESKLLSRPATLWIPYVLVSDLGRSVSRVQQLGGSVWLLPVDIPEVGGAAIIADPSGAPTGLFQNPG